MEDIKEAKKEAKRIVSSVVLVIITTLAVLGCLSADKLVNEDSKEA